MKFASIDIGSNAIRLLFCNVFEKEGEKPTFKKQSLIRVPIRLGEDAFTTHIISEEKIEKMVKTMIAFKNLIDVHEVISYRACATSAMREAANSKQVIDRIKKESGITIEIINGKTEAEIIYSNHIEQNLNSKKTSLYIDVGGGSTELTLFSGNKIVDSNSFNIGTIRILKDQINKSDWHVMRNWVSKITEEYKDILAIGSGGNINKLINLANKDKDDRTISLSKLKEVHEYLSGFTLEERIKELGLNPDRADVILPASEIFITVMKTAEIKKILVPQIGMSDGIVHLLYEQYKRQMAFSE